MNGRGRARGERAWRRAPVCRFLGGLGVWLGLLSGLAGVAGCVERTVVEDPWSDLRRLAGEPAEGPGLRQGDPLAERSASGGADVAVRLQRFEGEGARERARALKERLEREAYLPDLWIEAGDERATLYRGRYREADRDRARQALRQTRLVALEDRRPFRDARLVSLGGDGEQTVDEGGLDPWNLKAHSGRYSLQIGYYDSQYGSDSRAAAAEEAVRTLRKEEEVEAYYYHGPHRALVTVGLFDDHHFREEGGVTVYGEEIRNLQERFPHHMANGRIVMEQHGDQEVKQETFIVRVP